MRTFARQLAVVMIVLSSALVSSAAPASAADICGPRSVAVFDASQPEGSPSSPGTLHFTVLTFGCAAGTVQFQVAAGTATPGVDYVTVSGQLSWAPGDTSQRTISVPVVGDVAVEPDETLTLTLFNPVGLAVTDGLGAGTIINDDPFTVDVIGYSRPFCLETCVTCRLRVVLSSPATTAVSVRFATFDGTATAGADYVAARGTVTIPAGASSVEFGIGILEDTLREPVEQFEVSIFEPSMGRIGEGTAILTLADG